MELDFDKYCLVDGSPTTVLPAPRCHSKVTSAKPNYGNTIPRLGEDFIQIDLSHYLCASWRDAPSGRGSQESNGVLKRGSVYQTSKEVKLLQKVDAVVGREKIDEFSGETLSAFSLGIIDSLCCSDEDSSLVEQSMASGMSLSEHRTTSVCKTRMESCSGVSMDTCNSVNAPIKETDSRQRRDLSVNLHRSLSARFALPHSPAISENDRSRSSSPKTRFSPVRKMFDPFVKSKSRRSPLSGSDRIGCETKSGLAAINQNKISKKPCHTEYNYQHEEKENCNLGSQNSPAHLHGLLKFRNKCGVPFFEFSVKLLEDVFVTKIWKGGSGLTNWVYTFHSLHHTRKSNASGWRFKDSNRDFSMVAQMHVSCHLCTDFEVAGEHNDSMVTECVLYDIVHSRKSTSSQGNSTCFADVIDAPLVSNETLSWGNCEPRETSSTTKSKSQMPSLDSGCFEPTVSQPLTAAELHPELETAAIIMQVPFEKRESLKFKSGDKVHETLPNSVDIFRGISNSSNSRKMHVVIPAGNHSSPATESRGPSPLLDRWRLGGGCDCGGWDMACPLNALSSTNTKIDNQDTVELFVQGRKDGIPAFSMRSLEDGKYAVDFHAQLSSLQAVSICVAILHTAEVSNVLGQERSKHKSLQSDSTSLFTKHAIQNMMAEEERSSKVNQKMEAVSPSFILDPPFSPIARV